MSAVTVTRESLLRVVHTMPAAPQILARLGHHLVAADIGLGEIAALLRQDAGLTAQILRIANSAAYRPSVPSGVLEEALARVGLAEVYRLTGFAAIVQLADRTLPFYGITGAQLRENALLGALVMEALGRLVDVDPRAAYTAGLLRSTGKIALDRLAKAVAYRTDYEFTGHGPLAEWELRFVNLNNCGAAAAVLEAWRFPADIVAAIGDHYGQNATAPRFTHLLNLAAGAAERCGHGLPGERYYWTVTPERLAAAGVDERVVDEATRDALEKFGPLRAALG